MAGSYFRFLFNKTLPLNKTNIQNIKSIHTTVVSNGARPGTRSKARAKKVKAEIVKVGFIPHNKRSIDKSDQPMKRFHYDVERAKPKDDVYSTRYYGDPLYTVEQAFKAHQEMLHPTMLNYPDSFLYAKIEFNMQATKQTRNMEGFTKMSLFPHPFQRDEERTILVFCKGPALIKEALDAGASLAGGIDLIKKIQGGEIKVADYNYVLAHPDIMTEIVPLRGLMKKRYPSVRLGTLTTDIVASVKKFGAGVQYRVIQDKNQPDFGDTELVIGKLNMNPEQIEENVESLLKDLQSLRPKRPGLFITRCRITCPPSREVFRIDPFVYVEREISMESEALSDDEGEAAAVTA